MRTCLLSITVAFAASCGAPSADDFDETNASVSEHLIGDPALPECPEGLECYHGQQGRSLLGVLAPVDAMAMPFASARWGLIAVEHPSIQQASIDAHGLHVVSDGGRVLLADELIGLEFDSLPAGVTYRVAGLWPPDEKARVRYLIEFAQPGDAWKPLCPNSEYAYALPGEFWSLASSIFTESLMAGSFACASSAAAKALRWGLGPFDVSRMHQFSAAVRLARAEYCADGIPHTVDGTSVVVASLEALTGEAIEDGGPNIPPAVAGNFYFEAAWTGRGIDLVTSTMASTPPDYAVTCLSKLRWQSLPPGGYCPNTLPDPRLNSEFGNRYVFCDDLPGFPGDRPPSVAFMTYVHDTYGATAVSMSQFNDRGLWAWPADSTNDMLTTTRGFWAGGLSRSATDRPAPGFGNSRPTFVSRVLTAERVGTTKALYLYRKASGHYRTTTDPSLDAGRCTALLCPIPWVKQGGPIGWVYTAPGLVPEGQTPIELRQWVKRINGVVIDTVLLGSFVAAPAGYEIDASAPIEGYGF
jgi:hypothetical protein